MVLSREALHRRALRLEWLTTAWNAIEAAVALAAGLILSVASLIAMPSLGYAKQVTDRRLGSKAMAADADPGGALLMVPFVVWQGIRAMGEARANEDSASGEGGVHDRG